MMTFLRKHMKVIFLITIVGFLAGAFIGFGGYFFGDAAHADAAATVNGTKIPYQRYATLLNRVTENMRRSKEDVDADRMKSLRQEVLQDLIQEEVFWKEAQKYGISVSDQELAADIQSYPAFQREGRFDPQLYRQALYQVMRTTLQEFEESRRRQIAIFKLRQLIAGSVQVSEPEAQIEYQRTHNGTLKGYDKDRDKFIQGLRQQKVMMVFNDWFQQLNRTLRYKSF
jgi:peptidyl-prolyl cis-trans isomerase D